MKYNFGFSTQRYL